MSSRVFQSVIVQMKEATDRMIGVIDADSTVISCSDTSRIGEKWPEAVIKLNSAPDSIVVVDKKTFKPLVSWSAYFDYAVFAEGEKAREAEAAGADIIGSDELVAQIQKGEINFDAAIATPNMMAKVGRIGKILGPRGLMPNPKLGTVTMDVAKMVSELKAGRVEYRADRYGICHVPLGKKSFSEQQLVENYAALYTEILRVKPSSAKGKYVKSISVSSTMGPGVKVDPAVQRDFLAE